MSATSFIVVGAGLAGSATAWSLAERGHEVTVLERTEPANAQGSSHGSARIFRYAYPDAFWVDLVVRSRARYAQAERLSGRELITRTGSVDYGSVRNPELLARFLQEAGVEHELLTAAQANDRWPQLAVDSPALWHPDAGVIDAHHSVHAMLAAAQSHGATTLTDWPVQRVERTAAGYRVHAADGRRLDAQRVVVAAGGWLPALLAELPLPAAITMPALQVRQENAYHLPYRPEFGGDESWPTVIHRTPEFYTYALPGGRDADHRGLKLAQFNGGRVIASAAEQDGRVDPRNQAVMTQYARERLPGVVPEPYATTTCLFTNTATEDFVVDEADGLTIVSPCSGHGAKLAPIVGVLAADVASGEARPPERFTAAAIRRAGTAGMAP